MSEGSQQAVNTAAVAAGALAVWDAFISADCEIVTLSRWTTSKSLHLLSRYLGIAVVILNAAQSVSSHNLSDCTVYLYILAALAQVVFAAVGLISTCHVRALYPHNSFLRFAVYGLVSASIIAQAVILGVSFGFNKPHAAPHRTTGCMWENSPYDSPAFWWPAFIFQTILVVLAIVRAISVARVSPSWESVGRGVKYNMTLPSAAVCAGLLIKLVLIYARATTASRAMTAWLFSLFSIVGARMQIAEEPAGGSGPSLRETNADPMLDGFVIVRTPCDVRHFAALDREAPSSPRRSDWFGTSSTATTTLEFASRMSPDNARVDANYDAGDTYVPVPRRNAIPEEWP